MNRWIQRLVAGLVVLTATNSRAVDRYVAWDNAEGASTPFLSWAAAATNIQDAIDVSVDNDVIWVAPGTYSVPTNPGTGYYGETNIVTISGLSLTLRSSSSVPEETIINGGGKYRGIYPYPGSGERILVDGFTISNCWALRGAGMAIRAENSRTVTVHNCVFTSNTASTAGGGVYIWNPSDKTASLDYAISNCVFVGNQVTNGSSGALHNVVRGGGKQGLIVDCTIVSNTANTTSWGNAGGLFFRSGNAVIDRSTLIHNVAVGDGRGGAINLSGGWLIVRNCLIQSNKGRYGAVYTHKGHIYLQNCTLADNAGAALWTHEPGNYICGVNTIVYNNPISMGFGGANYSFTNSCVPTDTPAAITNVVNMIYTNAPGFVDAGNHNYRLVAASPCRNTGTNQAWMSGALELDGNPRLDSRIVDIGAYEYVTYGTAIMVQ